MAPAKFVCGERNCEKSYTRRYTLKKHQFESHGIGFGDLRNRCPQLNCTRVFKLNTTLERHLINKHGINPSSAKVNQEARILCDNPSCGMSFARKQERNLHLVRIHAIVPKGYTLTCPRCRSTFGTCHSYQDHTNNHCWTRCNECCEAGLEVQCVSNAVPSKESPCAPCRIKQLPCTPGEREKTAGLKARILQVRLRPRIPKVHRQKPGIRKVRHGLKTGDLVDEPEDMDDDAQYMGDSDEDTENHEDMERYEVKVYEDMDSHEEDLHNTDKDYGDTDKEDWDTDKEDGDIDS